MLAASGTTTDHDAAPAATASDSEKQAGCRRAATSAGEAGIGDAPMVQPAARQLFGRMHTDWDGTDYVVVCKSREEAERFKAAGHQILHISCPLQPEPAAPPAPGVTLTDAEREAVAYFGQIDGPYYLAAANTHAATLRGLLERAAKEDGR